MSESRKGDVNYWEKKLPSSASPTLMLRRSLPRPLRESHRGSILASRRRWQAPAALLRACVCFPVLSDGRGRARERAWQGGDHPEKETERETEMKKKKWRPFLINQVKVPACWWCHSSDSFFLFFSSPSDIRCFHLFLVFNRIKPNKCKRKRRRRARRGSGSSSAARRPLCQMRSVDISHQTGADQRPACAHAGQRIKSHHAQPPWQKNEKIKKASPHE